VFRHGMNSDLTDAGTDCRHRLRVQRLQPLLNQPKLKSRESSRISRECQHITTRGPEPQDRLIGHGLNMQVLVYCGQGARAFKLQEMGSIVFVMPCSCVRLIARGDG
jgi:hypothetical protein